MITGTFTDVHGETHSNVVIMVRHAHHNSNSTQDYNIGEVDGVFSEDNSTSSSYGNSSLTFDAVFYPSVESISAGTIPKQVLWSTHSKIFNDSGNLDDESQKSYNDLINIDVRNLPNTYLSLSAKEQAEKFIQEHILDT